MGKLKQFYKFLDTTSLSGENKRSIKFMIDFLNGNHIPELANKSFLFSGEGGIGKTYLAEKLIESLELPVLSLTSGKIDGRKVKRVNSLNELVKQFDKFEYGIIFMDDLKYVIKFDNELEEPKDDEKKRFMKLLEHLKAKNKKVVLIITLNDMDCLDDSWLDRIEVKIEFNLPSEENKLSFLNENFSKYAVHSELKYIADNSIGYNYRDLPNLIKMAYREGDRKISIESIKKAIALYTPSTLIKWEIEHTVKIRFSDIIGNNHAKKELGKLKMYLKNKKKLDSLGIKKTNLMIFSGSPGTGKTYMAMALAGELGVPIVKINALDIYRAGPVAGIYNIINFTKRFRNCVVFIDDADKAVGHSPISFDEEGPILAEFCSEVDDATNEVQSIVILAVNSIRRLGAALQDRFAVIKLNNPNFEERKEFINRLMDKAKFKWKLQAEDLAKITDNLSYRDIQRIWNDCVFYYMQNKKMDISTLQELISETKQSNSITTMIG